MSNDKKSSTAAEPEYQYGGEEPGAQESLEPPQKRTPPLQMIKEKLLEKLPKKKKYRVLLFIGIAIYILYKFINVGTPPAKETVSTAEKINAQQLAKPKETPPVPVAEKKPAPVAQVAPPKETTKNFDLLKNSANNETNAQIKDLQSSLDQMNRSVTTLESSLLSLTNSVIRLSEKVTALEKAQQKVKASAAIQQPVLLVYYLHSLTSGRAWVQSVAGDFTSVKVGDSLPGYGQVQKIDVISGVIYTASGRTITYGPNDS